MQIGAVLIKLGIKLDFERNDLMQTTTNLGLKKPDYTDGADIGIINDNMDKLDELVGNLSPQFNETFVKKVGDTLTGALTAGGTQVLTTKQVRNMTISTASPSGGSNGDVWIKYS